MARVDGGTMARLSESQMLHPAQAAIAAGLAVGVAAAALFRQPPLDPDA